MKMRAVTTQEKYELYEYLTATCQGKFSRETIESIGKDAPIVVMEDYVIPQTNFRGKVLLAYMPIPDAKSCPHIYCWQNGKITRAGGKAIK